MGTFISRLIDFFAGTDLFLGLLWLGLAALTVTLLVLMRTQWGQSRPLRKCLLLSLLAHVLLIGYATTVTIVSTVPTSPGEPVIRVFLAEETSRPETTDTRATVREKPWEQLVHDEASQPAPTEPARATPIKTPEPRRTPPSTGVVLPVGVNLEHLPLAEAARPDPASSMSPDDAPRARTMPGKSAEPIDAPAAQRREGTAQVVSPQAPPERREAPPESIRRMPRPPDQGVPWALLKHQAPPPRMKDVPISPDPADALAALADAPSAASRGKPAESTVGTPDPSPRRGTGVSRGGTGVSRGGTGVSPVLRQKHGQDARATRRGDDTGAPTGPTIDPGPPQLPSEPRRGGRPDVPEIYRLRVALDRARIAQSHGATPETEAAVRAALRWLADNQEADGRWAARRHGAGRESMIAARNRRNAGIQADTATTGLALLAFLAAGHTHQEGSYPSEVRRGLEYLLRVQKTDGSMAGPATAFAAMYCHAIATLAVSEAMAMTADERLREPIRRAVRYSVSAQDVAGGGWRYVPGDPGDTSQLGWQLMALKSAEAAGIGIPSQTWRRMIHFLADVSSGRHGGLAAYRPGLEPSRPMTAEALVCRQFLGMPPSSATGNEAGDYLLGRLPGEGRANFYYWYYATLGMYQLHGDHWRRWNDAMQTTLVRSQRKTGPLAGSWDPESVWGGYGGRVYSTAMGTLCLEVYYRFLPLYGG
jgi:hypothetical protein